jgi:hypothetical protein
MNTAGWQSIETVPRDGTKVCCAEFEDGRWIFWEDSWRKYVGDFGEGLGKWRSPSHWIGIDGLPEPPVEQSTDTPPENKNVRRKNRTNWTKRDDVLALMKKGHRLFFSGPSGRNGTGSPHIWLQPRTQNGSASPKLTFGTLEALKTRGLIVRLEIEPDDPHWRTEYGLPGHKRATVNQY